jgi:hypothetical protein
MARFGFKARLKDSQNVFVTHLRCIFRVDVEIPKGESIKLVKTNRSETKAGTRDLKEQIADKQPLKVPNETTAEWHFDLKTS